jgi:hypothetical protein
MRSGKVLPQTGTRDRVEARYRFSQYDTFTRKVFAG